MMNIETPAAKSGDPETSYLAAEAVTKSGARQAQIVRVVAMVQETNGLTSRELADHHREDRYMVARRMSEAETAQEVERGPVRIYEIGKCKAVTWWEKGTAPAA